MPRGGGGGFGGGFGGGGFGGGGFRGSSFGSFRSSSFGSSRPFGRTGAQRTVSRSSAGPYRHSYGSYYRPYGYRPYYGYGFGSWYRWGLWGSYYRPFYRTPIFMGGGIIMLIVFALIFLPLMGVVFAYPFSDADTNGDISYRATEQLNFNEYWYEYEYIESGNEIEFTVESTPSIISFAISDQPFYNLPTTSREGGVIHNMTLADNEYRYQSVFLKPGSTIEYSFYVNSSLDFFISDGTNLNQWILGQTATFYVDEANVGNTTGTYYATRTQDYYMVWYNSEGMLGDIDLDYMLNYTAVNVVDFSDTLYYEEGVYNIDGKSVTVPSSGDWYFFVYFDPLNSPEEYTWITFDVKYSTGVTAVDRWASARPILIGIVIVVIILIGVGIFAQQVQKKNKDKDAKKKVAQTVTSSSTSSSGTSGAVFASTATSSTSPTKSSITLSTTKPASTSSGIDYSPNCIRCGGELKPTDKFCTFCGSIREGRQMGGLPGYTPASSKFCQYCGETVRTGDKFCKGCGAGIK